MSKKRRVMVRETTIRFSPVFECECCGKVEVGVAFSQTFYHRLPELDEIDVPAHTLPPGWIMFHNLQYCVNCNIE
jgi:hypothetical protein